jgi:hypothetical protein
MIHSLFVELTQVLELQCVALIQDDSSDAQSILALNRISTANSSVAKSFYGEYPLTYTLDIGFFCYTQSTGLQDTLRTPLPLILVLTGTCTGWLYLSLPLRNPHRHLHCFRPDPSMATKPVISCTNGDIPSPSAILWVSLAQSRDGFKASVDILLLGMLLPLGVRERMRWMIWAGTANHGGECEYGLQ